MRKVVISGLLTAVLFLGAVGTVDAAKLKLKWGSTSVGSGLYANTVTMAGIVNRAYPNDIDLTVVETGGFIENLSRIERKFIHLGPASAAAAYASYQGIIDFKKPNPTLRSLWGGYVTPIHIITSKKSGITALEALNGVPYAMNPGTTSGRIIELFFDALGIKPNYKLMGISASVDAMKSGSVQGWFKAGFKDAAVLDLESAMEVNIIPVTKSQIDKMNAKYPGHGLLMTIPAGLFKATPKEQISYAYVVSDFVHKDISADVVYKIVKAVYDHRKDLNTLATLKEGKFEEMYKMALDFDLLVPFHPGAVKFYEETLGVKVPAKLRPPEMK
jgi:TRAP transporter TAXI family solute receptor